jgi:beta-lactamase regulating signal transducer with metallopeptidase domain/HEAT repeat protein
MIVTITTLNELGRQLAGLFWQMSLEIAILAAIVLGVISLFRIKSPAMRYAFWCLVLIKPVASLVVASPVSFYRALPPAVTLPASPSSLEAEPPAIAPPAQGLRPGPIGEDDPGRIAPASDIHAEGAMDEGETTGAAVAAGSSPPAEATTPLSIYGIAAIAWLAGVAVLSLRIIAGGVYLAIIRRRASRQYRGPIAAAAEDAARALNIRRDVPIALSGRVAGPMLVGVVHPIVLLPERLPRELSAQQLRLVVTHELVHVRRWDNVVLVFQRALEVLLFFHPVIWLCGAIMRREAEAACDDVVVAAAGNSTPYADSLTRVAEQQSGLTHRVLASTFAATESDFSRRVRRILRGPAGRMTLRLTIISIACLIGIAAFGLPASGQRPHDAKLDDVAKPAPTSRTAGVEGSEAAEAEKGRDAPSVLPSMFDTYEYYKRTKQVVGERRQGGWIYFSVRRLQQGPSWSIKKQPAQGYRCNIPAGQPGFVAGLPPDRAHKYIPHTDQAIFANFAPACFALMCEGIGYAHRTGAWTFASEEFIWAAVRNVERGQASSPAIAETGGSSRQMEIRSIAFGDRRRMMGTPYLTREIVEGDHWLRCPSFMPGGYAGVKSPVDTTRPVRPGDVLVSLLLPAENVLGNVPLFLPWADEGDTADTEARRKLCQKLSQPDSFIAGPELIVRGTVPPDKQELYQRACRKAQFNGSYFVRSVHVEVAAIEMGISKRPLAVQEEILRDWQRRLAGQRDVCRDHPTGFDFLSFPGPRPWLPRAAEALGIDTGLSKEDLTDGHLLDSFVADLSSDDVAARREAAWNIARLSSAAASATGNIVTALDDPDAQVRRWAANALMRIGRFCEGPESVAAACVLRLSGDKSPEVRRWSAGALGMLGLASPAVIEALHHAADKDSDASVREWAARSLSMQLAPTSAEALEAMVTLMASDDPDVLKHAAWALHRNPQRADKELQSVLVGLLDHPKRDVWLASAWTLAKVDPDCEALVPMLLEKLRSPVPLHRFNACHVLRDLGPRAKAAKAPLFEAMLRPDNGSVRQPAARALAKIGLDADDVGRLINMLSNESSEVRVATVVALSDHAGPDRPQRAKAVIARLADSSPEVRSAAAVGLRSFGPDAVAALPALTTMATDDDDARSRSAAMRTVDVVRLARASDRPVAGE